MIGRRLPLLLLLLCLGTWPSGTFAQDPALDQDPALKERFLIVSVQGQAWEGVERRVRVELELLGLSVSVRRRQAPATLEELEDLHRALAPVGLLGAVMLTRTGKDDARKSVRIWLSDAVTQKQVVRTLEIPPEGFAEDVLALEIVELLRASLLELRLKKNSPPPSPPSPIAQAIVDSALPFQPPPPSRAIRLEAGPQAQWLLDQDVGGWAGAGVSLWVTPWQRAELGLTGAYFLTGGQLTSQTHLNALSLTLAGRLHLWKVSTASVFALANLGSMLLWEDAQAEGDKAQGFVALGGIGSHIPLLGPLHAGLNLQAGALLTPLLLSTSTTPTQDLSPVLLQAQAWVGVGF